jgi:hypothetical protein
MKTNTLMGVAFMLISLHSLSAQDSIRVKASVAKQFEEVFRGAKDAHWVSLPKKISQVQFHHQRNSWLAYFDDDGKLLASGRRIKSVNDLPLQVQEGFRKAKARMERKVGNAAVTMIYEMRIDSGTKYYFSLQNHKSLATFSITSDGIATLEKKRIITTETKFPKNVIAKEN